MKIIPVINKGVCAGLCVVLFLTNSALAHAVETNFWEERKRASQDVARLSLPAPVLKPVLAPAIQKSLKKIRLPEGKKSTQDLVAALSGPHGHVQKVHLPKAPNNTRTLIHIHDVHQNREAQQNIAETLKRLNRRGLVEAVALEAAFEPLPIGRLKTFPHPDLLATAATHLFEKGKMGGPALAALSEDQKPIPYVGVDSPDHYHANVEAYKEATVSYEANKQAWEKDGRTLSEKKRTVFNPSLLALDQKVGAYRTGEASVGETLQFLAEKNQWISTEVETFLAALDLEKTMNVARVEAERTHVINLLVKKLKPHQTKELLSVSVAYRSEQISHTTFYKYLKNLLTTATIDIARFKALNAYLQYVLLSDSVNVDSLMQDMRVMEEKAYEALIQNEAEQALVEESKKHYLTGKLLDFALTPHEWVTYKNTLNSVRRTAYEKFYEEAEARDRAISQNLLRLFDNQDAKTIVLVTGGFHAKGIAQEMQNNGVTTLAFVPKLTHLGTQNSELGTQYLSVFAQEKTPLEEILEGEKLFLGERVLEPAEQFRVVSLATGLGVALERIKSSAVTSVFKSIFPKFSMKISVKQMGARAVQLVFHGIKGAISYTIRLPKNVLGVASDKWERATTFRSFVVTALLLIGSFIAGARAQFGPGKKTFPAHPKTKLVQSFGKSYIRGDGTTMPDTLSSSYDQSLQGLAYLRDGKNKEATQLLNFYNTKSKAGKFNGFYRWHKTDGSKMEDRRGFLDENYTGDNLWVALFALHHADKTKTNDGVDLAAGVVKWVAGLNKDKPGVVLGPKDTDVYSTEHNIDYYAVLKLLLKKAPNHADAPFWKKELASTMGFLRDTLSDENGIPWRGAKVVENGKLELDGVRALDTISWLISAAGPDGLKEMNFDMNALLVFANKEFTVMENGEVVGYDITNKTEQEALKRPATVWIEGTAQMAMLFNNVLAPYYEKNKDLGTAKAYRDLAKKLTASMDKYKLNNGGYPAASGHVKTFSDGWWTPPPTHAALAATQWRSFVGTLNPFSFSKDQTPGKTNVKPEPGVKLVHPSKVKRGKVLTADVYRGKHKIKGVDLKAGELTYYNPEMTFRGRKILDIVKENVNLPVRTVALGKDGRVIKRNGNEITKRTYQIGVLEPKTDQAQIDKLKLKGNVKTTPVLVVRTTLRMPTGDRTFTRYYAKYHMKRKVDGGQVIPAKDIYELARVDDPAGYNLFNYSPDRPIGEFPTLIERWAVPDRFNPNRSILRSRLEIPSLTFKQDPVTKEMGLPVQGTVYKGGYVIPWKGFMGFVSKDDKRLIELHRTMGPNFIQPDRAAGAEVNNVTYGWLPWKINVTSYGKPARIRRLLSLDVESGNTISKDTQVHEWQVGNVVKQELRSLTEVFDLIGNIVARSDHDTGLKTEFDIKLGMKLSGESGFIIEVPLKITGKNGRTVRTFEGYEPIYDGIDPKTGGRILKSLKRVVRNPLDPQNPRRDERMDVFLLGGVPEVLLAETKDAYVRVRREYEDKRYFFFQVANPHRMPTRTIRESILKNGRTYRVVSDLQFRFDGIRFVYDVDENGLFRTKFKDNLGKEWEDRTNLKGQTVLRIKRVTVGGKEVVVTERMSDFIWNSITNEWVGRKAETLIDGKLVKDRLITDFNFKTGVATSQVRKIRSPTDIRTHTEVTDHNGNLMTYSDPEARVLATHDTALEHQIYLTTGVRLPILKETWLTDDAGYKVGKTPIKTHTIETDWANLVFRSNTQFQINGSIKDRTFKIGDKETEVYEIKPEVEFFRGQVIDVRDARTKEKTLEVGTQTKQVSSDYTKDHVLKSRTIETTMGTQKTTVSEAHNQDLGTEFPVSLHFIDPVKRTKELLETYTLEDKQIYRIKDKNGKPLFPTKISLADYKKSGEDRSHFIDGYKLNAFYAPKIAGNGKPVQKAFLHFDSKGKLGWTQYFNRRGIPMTLAVQAYDVMTHAGEPDVLINQGGTRLIPTGSRTYAFRTVDILDGKPLIDEEHYKKTGEIRIQPRYTWLDAKENTILKRWVDGSVQAMDITRQIYTLKNKDHAPRPVINDYDVSGRNTSTEGKTWTGSIYTDKTDINDFVFDPFEGEWIRRVVLSHYNGQPKSAEYLLDKKNVQMLLSLKETNAAAPWYNPAAHKDILPGYMKGSNGKRVAARINIGDRSDSIIPVQEDGTITVGDLGKALNINVEVWSQPYGLKLSKTDKLRIYVRYDALGSKSYFFRRPRSLGGGTIAVGQNGVNSVPDMTDNITDQSLRTRVLGNNGMEILSAETKAVRNKTTGKLDVETDDRDSVIVHQHPRMDVITADTFFDLVETLIKRNQSKLAINQFVKNAAFNLPEVRGELLQLWAYLDKGEKAKALALLTSTRAAFDKRQKDTKEKWEGVDKRGGKRWVYMSPNVVEWKKAYHSGDPHNRVAWEEGGVGERRFRSLYVYADQLKNLPAEAREGKVLNVDGLVERTVILNHGKMAGVPLTNKTLEDGTVLTPLEQLLNGENLKWEERAGVEKDKDGHWQETGKMSYSPIIGTKVPAFVIVVELDPKNPNQGIIQQVDAFRTQAHGTTIYRTANKKFPAQKLLAKKDGINTVQGSDSHRHQVAPTISVYDKYGQPWWSANMPTFEITEFIEAATDPDAYVKRHPELMKSLHVSQPNYLKGVIIWETKTGIAGWYHKLLGGGSYKQYDEGERFTKERFDRYSKVLRSDSARSGFDHRNKKIRWYTMGLYAQNRLGSGIIPYLIKTATTEQQTMPPLTLIKLDEGRFDEDKTHLVAESRTKGTTFSEYLLREDTSFIGEDLGGNAKIYELTAGATLIKVEKGIVTVRGWVMGPGLHYVPPQSRFHLEPWQAFHKDASSPQRFPKGYKPIQGVDVGDVITPKDDKRSLFQKFKDLLVEPVNGDTSFIGTPVFVVRPFGWAFGILTVYALILLNRFSQVVVLAFRSRPIPPQARIDHLSTAMANGPPSAAKVTGQQKRMSDLLDSLIAETNGVLLDRLKTEVLPEHLVQGMEHLWNKESYINESGHPLLTADQTRNLLVDIRTEMDEFGVVMNAFDLADEIWKRAIPMAFKDKISQQFDELGLTDDEQTWLKQGLEMRSKETPTYNRWLNTRDFLINQIINFYKERLSTGKGVGWDEFYESSNTGGIYIPIERAASELPEHKRPEDYTGFARRTLQDVTWEALLGILLGSLTSQPKFIEHIMREAHRLHAAGRKTEIIPMALSKSFFGHHILWDQITSKLEIKVRGKPQGMMPLPDSAWRPFFDEYYFDALYRFAGTESPLKAAGVTLKFLKEITNNFKGMNIGRPEQNETPEWAALRETLPDGTRRTLWSLLNEDPSYVPSEALMNQIIYAIKRGPERQKFIQDLVDGTLIPYVWTNLNGEALTRDEITTVLEGLGFAGYRIEAWLNAFDDRHLFRKEHIEQLKAQLPPGHQEEFTKRAKAQLRYKYRPIFSFSAKGNMFRLIPTIRTVMNWVPLLIALALTYWVTQELVFAGVVGNVLNALHPVAGVIVWGVASFFIYYGVGRTGSFLLTRALQRWVPVDRGPPGYFNFLFNVWSDKRFLGESGFGISRIERAKRLLSFLLPHPAHTTRFFKNLRVYITIQEVLVAAGFMGVWSVLTHLFGMDYKLSLLLVGLFVMMVWGRSSGRVIGSKPALFNLIQFFLVWIYSLPALKVVTGVSGLSYLAVGIVAHVPLFIFSLLMVRSFMFLDQAKINKKDYDQKKRERVRYNNDIPKVMGELKGNRTESKGGIVVLPTVFIASLGLLTFVAASWIVTHPGVSALTGSVLLIVLGLVLEVSRHRINIKKDFQVDNYRSPTADTQQKAQLRAWRRIELLTNKLYQDHRISRKERNEFLAFENKNGKFSTEEAYSRLKRMMATFYRLDIPEFKQNWQEIPKITLHIPAFGEQFIYQWESLTESPGDQRAVAYHSRLQNVVNRYRDEDWKFFLEKLNRDGLITSEEQEKLQNDEYGDEKDINGLVNGLEHAEKVKQEVVRWTNMRMGNAFRNMELNLWFRETVRMWADEHFGDDTYWELSEHFKERDRRDGELETPREAIVRKVRAALGPNSEWQAAFGRNLKWLPLNWLETDDERRAVLNNSGLTELEKSYLLYDMRMDQKVFEKFQFYVAVFAGATPGDKEKVNEYFSLIEKRTLWTRFIHQYGSQRFVGTEILGAETKDELYNLRLMNERVTEILDNTRTGRNAAMTVQDLEKIKKELDIDDPSGGLRRQFEANIKRVMDTRYSLREMVDPEFSHPQLNNPGHATLGTLVGRYPEYWNTFINNRMFEETKHIPMAFIVYQGMKDIGNLHANDKARLLQDDVPRLFDSWEGTQQLLAQLGRHLNDEKKREQYLDTIFFAISVWVKDRLTHIHQVAYLKAGGLGNTNPYRSTVSSRMDALMVAYPEESSWFPFFWGRLSEPNTAGMIYGMYAISHHLYRVTASLNVGESTWTQYVQNWMSIVGQLGQYGKYSQNEEYERRYGLVPLSRVAEDLVEGLVQLSHGISMPHGLFMMVQAAKAFDFKTMQVPKRKYEADHYEMNHDTYAVDYQLSDKMPANWKMTHIFVTAGFYALEGIPVIFTNIIFLSISLVLFLDPFHSLPLAPVFVGMGIAFALAINMSAILMHNHQYGKPFGFFKFLYGLLMFPGFYWLYTSLIPLYADAQKKQAMTGKAKFPNTPRTPPDSGVSADVMYGNTLGAVWGAPLITVVIIFYAFHPITAWIIFSLYVGMVISWLASSNIFNPRYEQLVKTMEDEFADTDDDEEKEKKQVIKFEPPKEKRVVATGMYAIILSMAVFSVLGAAVNTQALPIFGQLLSRVLSYDTMVLLAEFMIHVRNIPILAELLSGDHVLFLLIVLVTKVATHALRRGLNALRRHKDLPRERAKVGDAVNSIVWAMFIIKGSMDPIFLLFPLVWTILDPWWRMWARHVIFGTWHNYSRALKAVLIKALGRFTQAEYWALDLGKGEKQAPTWTTVGILGVTSAASLLTFFLISMVADPMLILYTKEMTDPWFKILSWGAFVALTLSLIFSLISMVINLLSKKRGRWHRLSYAVGLMLLGSAIILNAYGVPVPYVFSLWGYEVGTYGVLWAVALLIAGLNFGVRAALWSRALYQSFIQGNKKVSLGWAAWMFALSLLIFGFVASVGLNTFFPAALYRGVDWAIVIPHVTFIALAFAIWPLLIKSLFKPVDVNGWMNGWWEDEKFRKKKVKAYQRYAVFFVTWLALTFGVPLITEFIFIETVVLLGLAFYFGPFQHGKILRQEKIEIEKATELLKESKFLESIIPAMEAGLRNKGKKLDEIPGLVDEDLYTKPSNEKKLAKDVGYENYEKGGFYKNAFRKAVVGLRSVSAYGKFKEDYEKEKGKPGKAPWLFLSIPAAFIAFFFGMNSWLIACCALLPFIFYTVFVRWRVLFFLPKLHPESWKAGPFFYRSAWKKLDVFLAQHPPSMTIYTEEDLASIIGLGEKYRTDPQAKTIIQKVFEDMTHDFRNLQWKDEYSISGHYFVMNSPYVDRGPVTYTVIPKPGTAEGSVDVAAFQDKLWPKRAFLRKLLAGAEALPSPTYPLDALTPGHAEYLEDPVERGLILHYMIQNTPFSDPVYQRLNDLVRGPKPDPRPEIRITIIEYFTTQVENGLTTDQLDKVAQMLFDAAASDKDDDVKIRAASELTKKPFIPYRTITATNPDNASFDIFSEKVKGTKKLKKLAEAFVKKVVSQFDNEAVPFIIRLLDPADPFHVPDGDNRVEVVKVLFGFLKKNAEVREKSQTLIFKTFGRLASGDIQDSDGNVRSEIMTGLEGLVKLPFITVIDEQKAQLQEDAIKTLSDRNEKAAGKALGLLKAIGTPSPNAYRKALFATTEDGESTSPVVSDEDVREQLVGLVAADIKALNDVIETSPEKKDKLWVRKNMADLRRKDEPDGIRELITSLLYEDDLDLIEEGGPDPNKNIEIRETIIGHVNNYLQLQDKLSKNISETLGEVLVPLLNNNPKPKFKLGSVELLVSVLAKKGFIKDVESEEVVEALIKTIASPEHRVELRVEVVKALGRLGVYRLKELLTLVASESSFVVRAALLAEIKALLAKLPSLNDDVAGTIHDLFIKPLGEKPSVDQMALAVHLVSDNGLTDFYDEMVKALEKLLSHAGATEEKALAAVTGLKAFGQRGRESLMKAIQDPVVASSARVRRYALESLADGDMNPTFMEILNNKKEYPEMRATAVWVVGQVSDDADDALVGLEDSDAGVRLAAVTAIGNIVKRAPPTDAKDTQRLTRILMSRVYPSDPDLSVRVRAAEVLSTISTDLVIPDLEKAATDKKGGLGLDPRRIAAIEVLGSYRRSEINDIRNKALEALSRVVKANVSDEINKRALLQMQRTLTRPPVGRNLMEEKFESLRTTILNNVATIFHGNHRTTDETVRLLAVDVIVKLNQPKEAANSLFLGAMQIRLVERVPFIEGLGRLGLPSLESQMNLVTLKGTSKNEVIQDYMLDQIERLIGQIDLEAESDYVDLALEGLKAKDKDLREAVIKGLKRLKNNNDAAKTLVIVRALKAANLPSHIKEKISDKDRQGLKDNYNLTDAEIEELQAVLLGFFGRHKSLLKNDFTSIVRSIVNKNELLINLIFKYRRGDVDNEAWIKEAMVFDKEQLNLINLLSHGVRVKIFGTKLMHQDRGEALAAFVGLPEISVRDVVDSSSGRAIDAGHGVLKVTLEGSGKEKIVFIKMLGLDEYEQRKKRFPKSNLPEIYDLANFKLSQSAGLPSGQATYVPSVTDSKSAGFTLSEQLSPGVKGTDQLVTEKLSPESQDDLVILFAQLNAFHDLLQKTDRKIHIRHDHYHANTLYDFNGGKIRLFSLDGDYLFSEKYQYYHWNAISRYRDTEIAFLLSLPQFSDLAQREKLLKAYEEAYTEFWKQLTDEGNPLENEVIKIFGESSFEHNLYLGRKAIGAESTFAFQKAALLRGYAESKEEKSLVLGDRLYEVHREDPEKAIQLNAPITDEEPLNITIIDRELEPNRKDLNRSMNELFERQVKAPGYGAEDFFRFYADAVAHVQHAVPRLRGAQMEITNNPERLNRPLGPKSDDCVLCHERILEKFPNELYITLGNLKLYFNPFAVFPPVKEAPAAEQPLHVIGSWGEGHRSQTELGDEKLLRDYRQALLQLNASKSLDEEAWGLGFNGWTHNGDMKHSGGASLDHVHGHFVRRPMPGLPTKVEWRDSVEPRPGVRVGLATQFKGPKADEDVVSLVLEATGEPDMKNLDWVVADVIDRITHGPQKDSFNLYYQQFRYGQFSKPTVRVFITGRLQTFSEEVLGHGGMGWPHTLTRFMELHGKDEVFNRMKGSAAEAAKIFRTSLLETSYNRAQIEALVDDLSNTNGRRNSGFFIGGPEIVVLAVVFYLIKLWLNYRSQKKQVAQPLTEADIINQIINGAPHELKYHLETFGVKAAVEPTNVSKNPANVLMVTPALVDEVEEAGLKTILQQMVEADQNRGKAKVLMTPQTQAFTQPLLENLSLSQDVIPMNVLFDGQGALMASQIEAELGDNFLQNATSLHVIIASVHSVVDFDRLKSGSLLNHKAFILVKRLHELLLALPVDGKNLKNIHKIARFINKFA